MRLSFMKAALAILLITVTGGFAYGLAEKDSADFDWKYEWTAAGMLPDAYDLDDRTGGDFWAVGYAASFTTAPGGYLLFSTALRSQNAQWQADGHNGYPGNVWPDRFNQEEGYTVEAAYQVTTTVGIEPYTVSLSSGLDVDGSDGPQSGLGIGPTGQVWHTGEPAGAIVLGGTVDNANKYHAFRIVAHPGSPPKFSVYRDNVMLADNLNPPYFAPWDRVCFGDTGSRLGGEAKMDYLRFTAGAWAPIGAVPLVFYPGDANKDYVVNEADAVILADNWLTMSGASWSMGDFNDDGKVDDADAALLATNWGKASISAVPEPAVMTLFLAGGGVLLLWRRR